MDLPPGRFPFPQNLPVPPALSLPAGSYVVALVRAVLAENERFLLEVAGALFEARIPEPLAAGDHIRLRVVSAAPDQPLVFEYTAPAGAADAGTLPPSQEDSDSIPVHLRRLELPDKPEIRLALDAALRTGAPVDRETVARIATAAVPPIAPEPSHALPGASGAFPEPPQPAAAAATADPARAYAAAVLVAAGVEPAELEVARLARVIREPAPAQPPAAPVMPTTPSVPAEVPELAQLARVASRADFTAQDVDVEHALRLARALERIVRAFLDESPALRRLDAAMDALLRETRAVAGHPAAPEEAEPLRARAEALAARIVAAESEDQARAIVRAIPTGEVALRTALLRVLEELERDEIARSLALRTLRAALAPDPAGNFPPAGEAFDQAAGVLVWNRLAAVRGDPAQVYIVPLPFGDGKSLARALVVFRRGREGGTAYEGIESVAIDVTFRRLGRVVANVTLARRVMRVRIGSADARARALMDRHRDELAAALRARGFEPEVRVEARDLPARVDLVLPPGPSGLDVRA